MSRILWKSFHLCFPTNLTKCSSPPCLPSSVAADDLDDPNPPSLNILYHHHSSSSTTTTTSLSATAAATSSSSSSYESDTNYDIAPDSPPPDFSAVFASRRFFFSSPGPSNAITDSPRELSDNYDNATSTSRTAKNNKKKNYDTATAVTTTRATALSVSRLLSGGAVLMQHVHSPDPYGDFRQSMQEMIDAMDGTDAEMAVEGYEFLHELLLSYLSLNPKDTHEFIIRAFADILASLLSDGRRR